MKFRRSNIDILGALLFIYFLNKRDQSKKLDTQTDQSILHEKY